MGNHIFPIEYLFYQPAQLLLPAWWNGHQCHNHHHCCTPLTPSTSHIFGLDDYCAICGNDHQTIWKSTENNLIIYRHHGHFSLRYGRMFFLLFVCFCLFVCLVFFFFWGGGGGVLHSIFASCFWRYECSTERPKLGISLYIQFLSQRLLSIKQLGYIFSHSGQPPTAHQCVLWTASAR